MFIRLLMVKTSDDFVKNDGAKQYVVVGLENALNLVVQSYAVFIALHYRRYDVGIEQIRCHIPAC